MSDSWGNRNWLKCPRRVRAMFSAVTWAPLDSSMGNNWNRGVNGAFDEEAVGDGLKRARRLPLDVDWWVSTGVDETGVSSPLVDAAKWACSLTAIRSRSHRFRRASLRDFRRSRSNSEHSEAKDTPESRGPDRAITELAKDDEDGEKLDVGDEMLVSGQNTKHFSFPFKCNYKTIALQQITRKNGLWWCACKMLCS